LVHQKALSKEGYLGFVSWHLDLQCEIYGISKFLIIKNIYKITLTFTLAMAKAQGSLVKLEVRRKSIFPTLPNNGNKL